MKWQGTCGQPSPSTIRNNILPYVHYMQEWNVRQVLELNDYFLERQCTCIQLGMPDCRCCLRWGGAAFFKLHITDNTVADARIISSMLLKEALFFSLEHMECIHSLQPATREIVLSFWFIITAINSQLRATLLFRGLLADCESWASSSHSLNFRRMRSGGACLRRRFGKGPEDRWHHSMVDLRM